MNDDANRPDTEDEIDQAAEAEDAIESEADLQDAERDAAGENAPPSIETLAAALAETRDAMLRAVADAENTRKRAEREIADARVYAVTAFARDLLSVGDNLARALDALSPEMRESMGEASRTLMSGIELTQKELVSALTRHGVKPINVERGSAFDPNLHQAAAQIPSNYPSGAVVEVIQSGWMIGERVLRAAVVAVSAGGGAPEPGASQSDPPEPGGSVDTTA